MVAKLRMEKDLYKETNMVNTSYFMSRDLNSRWRALTLWTHSFLK